MKKITGLLALTLVIGQTSTAQKLSIDNVRTFYHRGTGPIFTNEEVKGYFTLFQSDKVDKKTNEYTLQIVDENLNKVKDVKFTDSKTIQLLESAFNGTQLGFSYFDEDQKLLDFRVLGMDGKQKFNYTRTVDKKTRNYINQYLTYQKEGYENKTIFSIEDKGFISVMPIREDGDYTYEINFYGSAKKSQWTYTPTEPQKVNQAEFLGVSDSVAIFQVLKREKLMSKKTDAYLMGIYLHNGKKAFEFETNQKKFNFLPMNISLVRGSSSFALMGPYFEKDDNIAKSKSLGLGVWVMNNQGQISNEKYNSWEKEIGKHLSVNARGRVDDLGYVFFHDIIQTADGNFSAIGEGYKRVASGAGIAFKALQAAAGGVSSSSVTKIKVTDMIMLQFDPQFNIKSATIYDKNSNNVELLPGMDFMNITSIGLLVKHFFGGFDFTFTQLDKEHTTYSIGYTDYVRGKDYKGLTFNAISYYNGTVTTDKLNLNSESSRLTIYPAKPGSIMVSEYFKKAKRFDLRLEKIN